jgi:hypothetical protein
MQSLIQGFLNAHFGAGRRGELKHLSTRRKRKQHVMPLLAESEKGLGQAESAFEKKLEMW